MNRAERAELVSRIHRGLMRREPFPPIGEAERIFRVISRVTHATVAGEQRRSKRGREQMDRLVRVNVGHAIRVL